MAVRYPALFSNLNRCHDACASSPKWVGANFTCSPTKKHLYISTIIFPPNEIRTRLPDCGLIFFMDSCTRPRHYPVYTCFSCHPNNKLISPRCRAPKNTGSPGDKKYSCAVTYFFISPLEAKIHRHLMAKKLWGVKWAADTPATLGASSINTIVHPPPSLSSTTPYK